METKKICKLVNQIKIKKDTRLYFFSELLLFIHCMYVVVGVYYFFTIFDILSVLTRGSNIQ